MNSKHSLCLFIVVLIANLLGSCGSSNSVVSNRVIQKRKYSNGWHFNNRTSYSKEKDASDEIKFDSEDQQGWNKNELTALASDKNELTDLKREVEHVLIEAKIPAPSDSTECSEIKLKNGKSIEAKILEIEEYAIKYEDCNDKKNRVHRILKGAVSMIRYKNGDSQEFIKEVKKERVKPERKKWKIILRIIGLIILIVGGVILTAGILTSLDMFIIGCGLVVIGGLMVIISFFG